jgi:uncharacterized membrane protein YdfJ with MMPL/SSD domain
VRTPRAVLCAALLLAVVAGAWGIETPRLLGRGSNDFVASGSASVRADSEIQSATGHSAAPQLLVLVRRPTSRRIARVDAVVRATRTFVPTGSPVPSRDRRSALVAWYGHGGVSQQVWRDASRRIDGELRMEPGVVVGGGALATVQVNDQVQHDLTRAEVLAFLVFRGLVAALLPIVCGALTILGSLLLLRCLDALTPISTYALNIVTGAGLGLGIDYSLLLVSRFREELVRVGPGAEAVEATLRTAGRTVAFSCVTVGAAVATLAVFPLGFLRSMGIAGGLVGPLAGLISLTVLPALFLLLGERVNALSPKRWRRPPQRGGWYRLAHSLMRRPVPVAVVAAVVLIVAAVPLRNIRFTGVDVSVLPSTASSRVVDTIVQRDFPHVLATPAYAVLRGNAADASRYAENVHAPVVLPPRPIATHLWEIEASSQRPFLSRPARALVKSMRTVPDVLVGGSTALFLDQEHTIAGRLPLAIALICVVTFLLLWLATRSVVLAVKSLVMNALTLGATLGIMVFVFQGGRLSGTLAYHGQGALQLTQPVLVFALAFGLATDYGVFLLTRIREAADSGLPNREAVAVGLERTGRIVTAAALLFCIAVAAFATSKIILIKEVGLGIALAVAIDATIVRALLVPSLMAILGRWNWWPSGFLEAPQRRDAGEGRDHR